MNFVKYTFTFILHIFKNYLKKVSNRSFSESKTKLTIQIEVNSWNISISLIRWEFYVFWHFATVLQSELLFFQSQEPSDFFTIQTSHDALITAVLVPIVFDPKPSRICGWLWNKIKILIDSRRNHHISAHNFWPRRGQNADFIYQLPTHLHPTNQTDFIPVQMAGPNNRVQCFPNQH